MSITAIIEGISYQFSVHKNLKVIALENFNINAEPASCVIKNGFKEFAISK